MDPQGSDYRRKKGKEWSFIHQKAMNETYNMVYKQQEGTVQHTFPSTVHRGALSSI
jgi:hypothetical protein